MTKGSLLVIDNTDCDDIDDDDDLAVDYVMSGSFFLVRMVIHEGYMFEYIFFK